VLETFLLHNLKTYLHPSCAPAAKVNLNISLRTMAHFNERVQVREIRRGPGRSEGSWYVGAWADVVAQYSEPLAGVEHTDVSPTIDTAHLLDMSHHDPTPTMKKDRLISNWHIKTDGMVYQGSEHCSVVVRIEGNVVTTISGSRYVLTNRDPRIKEVMESIRKAYIRAPEYSSSNPLEKQIIPFLFAAEKLVYGELSNKRGNILTNLAEISGRVDFESTDPVSLVTTCFSPQPRDIGFEAPPSARISFALVVVEHPSRDCAGSRRFALVHEIDDRGWWLPGGGIDDGEDCIVGGTRECHEEAGVSAFAGPLRLLRVEITRGRLRWILHGVAASNELKTTSDDDSQGAIWATAAETRQLEQSGAPNPYLRGPEPEMWFDFVDSQRGRSFSFDAVELLTQPGAHIMYGRAAYNTALEVKIAIRSGTKYASASGPYTLPKNTASDGDRLEDIGSELLRLVVGAEMQPTGVLGIQAIQRRDGSGKFAVIYYFDCGDTAVNLRGGFEWLPVNFFVDYFEKKVLQRAIDGETMMPRSVIVHDEHEPITL